MCHAGNPWFVRLLREESCPKNTNVYADISGLIVGNFTHFNRDYYISKIKELLDYVGESHRLLYGSDWPICSMASYLSFVRKLKFN